MQFPYPVMLCDIGGTNVRCALARAAGAALIDLPSQKTADKSTFAAAIRAALRGAGVEPPRSLLACAAGPVENRGVKLTNASWFIDGPAAARELGLAQGLLFNDFEAQALSIPSLRPEWLMPIGPPLPEARGPRLIHGPGTGLGTAALVEANGRWLAIASEASHSDFAPGSAAETAFWPHVEPLHGRITPETLISGEGLRRLHRALAASRGLPRPETDVAAIIARARADRGSAEADSVRAFWRLAARFAGDMALTFVSTGGVTLAGGMLPRLIDLLDQKEFRAVFENRAPYAELARKIPVALLIEKDTVLAGLAAIAANPERYAIDYPNRCWRPLPANQAA